MKKIIGTVIVICLLCGVGITASASCRGWNGWQLSVIDRQMSNSNYPHATAVLTRCTCLPVDNYLYAGVRVQYRAMNGTQYYWSPTSGYIGSSGYDVENRTTTVTLYGNYLIVYAQAKFEAQCGSNTKSIFYRQWTGDPGEALGEYEK